MKYKNTVLIVHDLECSLSFYRKILGLHVIRSTKTQITFKGGLCLQSYEIWKNLIHKGDQDILFPSYNQELSFEEEMIEPFIQKLNQHNVTLLHPLKEQGFGVRVVRFYDPDGHIIAVYESLRKVIKRYLSQGLTHEEISKRMGIPIEYIEDLINERMPIWHP